MRYASSHLVGAGLAEIEAWRVGAFALLVVALSTLLASGCGPSEPDESTDPTPTAVASTTPPTPTPPTPTPAPPTPTPEVWQAFTMLGFDEGSGYDLDGDGAKDNGFPDAIETVADTLTEGVNAAIAAQGPGGSGCDEGGCPLTQQQVNTAQAAASQLISAAVSVAAINAALAAPYEAGARPLGLRAQVGESTDTLEYWSGAVDGTFWLPEGSLASLEGDLSVGKFGPFTFTLETAVGQTPGNPEGIVLGFTLYDVVNALAWNAAGMNDAVFAGGVEIVALVALAEALVQALIDADFISSEAGDQILEDVEDALLAVSDLTCASSGNPCMSAVLLFDTAAVTVQ